MVTNIGTHCQYKTFFASKNKGNTSNKNVNNVKQHESLLLIIYNKKLKGVSFQISQKQSTYLDQRQSLTELRKICPRAGEWSGSLPVKWSYPDLSEPVMQGQKMVLKWAITKCQNPRL